LQQFAQSEVTQPEIWTYNRQQFLWMVMTLTGYRQLVGDIGRLNAEQIANLLFDRKVRETNPGNGYILTTESRSDYSDQMDGLLQIEFAQITAKRTYAAELLDAASNGQLRRRLDEAAAPEDSDTGTPQSGRPEARDAEIRKACDWICRSVHGDGNESEEMVREMLTEHVVNAPPGEVLGPTPALLDRIHARIASDAPRHRSPNPATAYPSSIGGRYLLETVFSWTADALWPTPGDEQWLDVALFYLGAVGTVQGYPDGNKRAARMAYAITLLRGKHRFVAPSAALQAELIQMGGAES